MSNSTTPPPPPNYGTWTEPVAIASIIIMIPTCLVFIGNRHLYPIAQREPKWAVIAVLCYNFVIWMYLFEKVHPELPLWWTKVYAQLGEGIMMCLFLVRVWKLWIDAGLTTERVQNKFGWFVAHRHYRTPKFLWKMVAVLITFHLIVVPIEFVGGSANNIPARQSDSSLLAPILFAAIVLAYFFVYSIFGCKLRKMRDGFFIKTELVMVGIVGMIGTLLWLILQVMKVKCLFPSCTVFILWVTSTWMWGWSIIMPLSIAARDPRFNVFAIFKPRYKRAPGEESDFDTRDSGPDSRTATSKEASVGEVHTLSEEKLAKLRHIPLAKFLTYTPGKDAFRAFTVLEFSVENLLFVEAVKELETSPHTATEVRALYDRFVADSAPNQVNLTSAIVQRLKARIEDDPSCDAKVFEDATAHVYKMMQRDTYKRFQRTPEWVVHISAFDVENKQNRKGKKSVGGGGEGGVEMAENVNPKQADDSPTKPEAQSFISSTSTPQHNETASAMDVALNIDKASQEEGEDHP